MDRTLSGTTISGPSEPGSNGNEKVFRIPKTPALLEPPHQFLNAISRSLVRGSANPSADVQSVYSTTPMQLGKID